LQDDHGDAVVNKDEDSVLLATVQSGTREQATNQPGSAANEDVRKTLISIPDTS
jgi:hypothetical protein